MLLYTNILYILLYTYSASTSPSKTIQRISFSFPGGRGALRSRKSLDKMPRVIRSDLGQGEVKVRMVHV